MSDSIKFGSVALECPDARQLAAFYAEITGGTITTADPDWAAVRCPGGDIDFRATCAIGWEVSTTILAASSLNSGENFLRFLAHSIPFLSKRIL